MQAVQKGRMAAADLLPLLYDELRQLAAAKLAREAPGQTLQATALVHEAWLRVQTDGQPAWDGRAHFFGAAAEAMRRILVDNARRKQAIRHGGELKRTELVDSQIRAEVPDDELLEVHEALEALASEHPRKAELVKLRYFAGLTLEEAAGILGISEPTAKRDWAFARAWLRREIDRVR